MTGRKQIRDRKDRFAIAALPLSVYIAADYLRFFKQSAFNCTFHRKLQCLQLYSGKTPYLKLHFFYLRRMMFASLLFG